MENSETQGLNTQNRSQKPDTADKTRSN